MTRVTGIGGIFFKARDPKALSAWYRDHLAAGVISGRIFVAGGRNGRDFTMDVLEEYDPTAQTWRDRAPMPTGRSGIAGAAVGGRFFVFGGEGNRANAQGIFDAVEVYDPAQETWARLPPMRPLVGRSKPPPGTTSWEPMTGQRSAPI